MALDIRMITDDEIRAFRETISTVFGGDLDEDVGGPERFKATVERNRAWAAFDRATMVATAATFTLVIGVPGGDLAMGGLTMVSVRPTHRRRGILRELIRLHLEDSRRRGETIQGLWASEATIYQRFGYGIANEYDDVTIDASPGVSVHVPGEPDAIEFVDEAGARTLLPDIYQRATARRPGVLRRTDVWWRERRFLEAQFVRHGASRLRHAVARRGDEPVGYVAYRQRGGFDAGQPTGKVDIIELIANDPRAEATLWRFALSIDLFPKVSWWCMPPDSALPWIISDPRRLRRRRTDGMWVRVDDVAAALGARRYAAEDILRFRLDDGTSYELIVEDGTGHCASTTRSADLELDRAALGSLFLGSVPATALANAGRITGNPAAVARADRLFAWPIVAWCPEVF